MPLPKIFSRGLAGAFQFAWILLLGVSLQASEQEVEIKFGGETSAAAARSATNSFWATTQAGMGGIFENSPSLDIPLGEVVVLVLLVNVFALFNKGRLIMAVSYLFCLKWVFWSNYAELAKHSNAVATVSGYVFIFCGILTAALFWTDRFRSRHD